MTGITVAGGGAFGTALAQAMAADGAVTLWCRDAAQADAITATRQNSRLPGITLSPGLTASSTPDGLEDDGPVLLAVPTQALRGFLENHTAALAGRDLIACCKGAELNTGRFPTDIIAEVVVDARPAVLSGPGFATEIARGLPTALTLAASDTERLAELQERLSTQSLRLYRTSDTVGVQAGGALKNVVAIACGMAMGAGLGESARAALMTRGFAEMSRLAVALGAEAGTLAGLSGLGDLALTCTSGQSRNFAHGLALGSGQVPPAGKTVEGAATAQAVVTLAKSHGVDMPVAETVASVLLGTISLGQAVRALLARPLRSEE